MDFVDFMDKHQMVFFVIIFSFISVAAIMMYITIKSFNNRTIKAKLTLLDGGLKNKGKI